MLMYEESYLFRQSFPCFLESVHRTVYKSSTDLQDTVVVVHTSTDICDGCPLLYTRYSLLEILPTDDLGHHQTTGLVEALADQQDMRGLEWLLRLHPSLAQQLPVKVIHTLLRLHTQWDSWCQWKACWLVIHCVAFCKGRRVIDFSHCGQNCPQNTWEKTNQSSGWWCKRASTTS